ncbi:MAG: hypothetical protein AB7O98_02125 [Hyphomonadaceae bacterium]
MFRPALFPAIAWALLGCAGPTGFPEASYAIIEGRQADLVCEARDVAANTWTPAEADIRRMEASLFPLLSRELLRDPEHNGEAEPEHYYRLYSGIVVDGTRMICVQGTHRSVYESQYAVRREWRDPVVIRDGGSVQFRVRYDPATDRFEDFAFNHVA